jgi:hypothetical protein
MEIAESLAALSSATFRIAEWLPLAKEDSLCALALCHKCGAQSCYLTARSRFFDPALLIVFGSWLEGVEWKGYHPG